MKVLLHDIVSDAQRARPNSELLETDVACNVQVHAVKERPRCRVEIVSTVRGHGINAAAWS